MQLVVMAAVLALVGAGQDCIFACHPVNVSIPVESCGRVESVSTTICEGHCYHEDTVFINYNDRDKQVCLADWAYEVKHFHGCPVGVTYPVARQCKCGVCNENNTFCGRLSGGISSCSSF